MADVQSCACPYENDDVDDNNNDYDDIDYEKEDEKRRIKSNTCATDHKKGAYKIGDVLVTYEDDRAYLHGIVNSESHYVFSTFSYTEISPLITELLSNNLITSSVANCSEDQMKCPSGVN